MAHPKPGMPMAVGYTALPAGGKGPGVLVLHAWWGLNDFFKGLCDRLAAEGFVVVAPDLWGGVLAGTEEEAQSLVDQRDGQAIFEAVDAALAHLRNHPGTAGYPLGAVGFSLGASWAIYMSTVRPEQLAAVVIFYGSGEGEFSAARAGYLGHFAVDDPWEPSEFIHGMEDAMRAAGREVAFHYYPGAGHWFFESDRPTAYVPVAADLAWERSLAFLKARLA